MSTKAKTLTATHRGVRSAARKPRVRPHLIIGAERRTVEGADTELSAQEASVSAAGLLSAHGGERETARIAAPAQYSPHWVYAALKRLTDVGGALVLSLAFSPLLLIIVVLTGLESGAILFRHRRIGQGGRTFDCLKFRTMVPNAEQRLLDLLEKDPQARAEWLRDHKLRNDPRVTRLGRFLRKSSLDELPQLWNVFRGEMSLVGPRPIVKEEMLRYGRYLRAYLAAKPGITGLWQVTGRNDTDYRRRVVMDTYYVRKQTFLMDMKILLRTVKVVIWGRGAY